MKYFIILVLIVLPALLFLGNKNITPYGDSTGSSIYFGVHTLGYPLTMSSVDKLESDIGRKASIIMIYQGWGQSNNQPNFNASRMDSIRSHGSIPMITWQPQDYVKEIVQPNFALSKIINGDYDQYITQYAKDIKKWNHPLFLRLAHEMNGNWYPWSEQINGNKPGEYVAMWKHVHDIFTAQGVTNVTWVWTPNNTDQHGKGGNLTSFYPGNEYVDWVGIDGYNYGTSKGGKYQNFADVFYNAYHEIVGFTDKPLMIGEMGSSNNGGDKAKWIADALTKFIPNDFPKIKAIIWFNENKEQDWRIESSKESQYAFSKAINSGLYSTNSFGQINSSPIKSL